ncbi:MAG: serine hydrolase domain-containing protein [Coleofasciculaceae cyanobacterium]
MNRLTSNSLQLLWGTILAINLFFLSGFDVALASPAGSFSPTPQTGLTNRHELETFIDTFFNEKMQTEHIPGAVFALVKDGKVFFSKGYGYADREKQIPISPDKTVFRVGSVSKLFTATAVMQLVEQGKLNLNDDVNNYLAQFHLKENYPKPVTVANLLTHTGGIEENFIGIAARSLAEITPLGEYLAKHLPPRALPPGEIIRYTNHGFALAGYLVEAVSQLPFASYIDQNILQPLGMTHSSFQLLPEISSDLAVGYRYKHGNYRSLPTVYTNDTPSGALNATALDMVHFAIAHLQNGRYGNVRILQEATAQQMHQQHFTNHTKLPGLAYGFAERFQNGQRAIEHDGHIAGYRSRLFLLPEKNLGFFAAYNNDKVRLHDQLVTQFLDHYYSVAKQPVSLPASNNFLERSKYFTGNYRYIRYPRQSIEKLAALLPGSPLQAPELKVTTNRDGTLKLGASNFVEIEPMLFEQFSGSPLTFVGINFSKMAFRENDHGKITHLFIGKYAFEKLSWYETISCQLTLLALCLFIFLSAPILWSAEYEKSIRHRKTYSSLKIWKRKSRLTYHWSRFIASLVCSFNLFFLIAFALVLATMNLSEFAYGIPSILIALLCLPLIATVLATSLPIFTVLAWKNKHGSILARFHYSLVTLAALTFIFLLDYWNLLGFRF